MHPISSTRESSVRLMMSDGWSLLDVPVSLAYSSFLLTMNMMNIVIAITPKGMTITVAIRDASHAPIMMYCTFFHCVGRGDFRPLGLLPKA